MSRTVPSALLSALGEAHVQPYYAVEFKLDDGDGTRYDQAGYAGTNAIRLWTGYGDRTIGVDTYLGTGDLMSIGGLEEAADLSAKSVTLGFSGIPSTIISVALQTAYQRRPCKIYFGTTDTASPIEIFSGLMNKMTIEDSGETSNISVLVDSKLVRLEAASNYRYTKENHQSRHPGDTFFNYVADLQDRSIVWGRESA
jgi:hypothetical protein